MRDCLGFAWLQTARSVRIPQSAEISEAGESTATTESSAGSECNDRTTVQNIWSCRFGRSPSVFMARGNYRCNGPRYAQRGVVMMLTGKNAVIYGASESLGGAVGRGLA